MYVSADIVSTTPALNIPTQAVFLKDNSPCVFVETAPGQFRRRTVKLGLESGGRSLVTEGVSVGQRVVAEGSLLLEAILEGASS
jgi:cobalt-zinc-cadmium efflux system membrane fusion protein